jgi:hypothetical protein
VNGLVTLNFLSGVKPESLRLVVKTANVGFVRLRHSNSASYNLDPPNPHPLPRPPPIVVPREVMAMQVALVQAGLDARIGL